ncbi:hypothetical protein GJ631_00640 [Natronomonas sp. CBA1123]|uniref:polysialyltransferase family glycosyltransferase n=1 Tax=Natronomonas sp. CBA1123 TaxID=2668070 RepID=UPI0012EA9934|nr:polysialyltransferase family glycosyltransferase [Natronomonas sp. CBA1123]MUV85124.1 hypothetical protein [Natronomonas sp. CBA1123]
MRGDKPQKSNMKNLYYAATPYHVILSIAIAEERPHQKHILYIRSGSGGMSKLVTSIKSDIPIFNSVIKKYDISKRGLNQSRLRKAQAAVDLIKRVYRDDIDRLFIFNDISGDAQSIMFFSQMSAEICHVEDGSAAYNKSSRNWTMDNILARKLLFGPWWRPIKVLGTSGYGDKIWVTHPSAVRDELHQMEKLQINPDNVQKHSQWARRYIKNTGINTKLDTISTVVFLPHSSLISEKAQYLTNIKSILDNYSSEGKTGIKYHPREQETPGFNFGSNTFEIPREIPAELLYLASNSIETVLGDVSTSLISALWLRNDIRVISYALNLNDHDANLFSAFDKIGITLVSGRDIE